MASNTEDFLIKLTESVSGPASKAEGALQRLESQIRREKSALSELEGKLSSAASNTQGFQTALDGAKSRLAAIKSGKEAFDPRAYSQANAEVVKYANALEKAQAAQAKLQAGVSAQGASLGQLQGAAPELQKLAGAEEDTGKAAEESGGALDGFQGIMRSIGPAARFVDGPLGKVIRLLGRGGLAGAAVAAIAILVILAATIVAVTLKIAAFALSSADAARSARLLADGAAGSTKAGAALDAVISRIASTVPLARDKIAEMASELELAGLAGKNAEFTLQAMATAASAAGEGAASKLREIAEAAQKARRFLLTPEELQGTGLALKDVAAALAHVMGTSVAAAEAAIRSGAVSVDRGLEAMAIAVQDKFGKTVAAQMLSLSVQFDKFKENLARLFEKVNLESFLAGLKTLTDLVSQNTAMGKSLRSVLGSVFSGLAQVLGYVAPLVSNFLKGFYLGFLNVYAAMKPAIAAIAKLFGSKPSDALNKIFADMGKLAAYAAVGLAVLVTILTLANPFFHIFALIALQVAAWLGAVIGIVFSAIAALGAFVGKVIAVVNSIRGINLFGAGSTIIGSLVSGMLSKLGAVGGAMGAVASMVAGALPGHLKMHSPSQVMEDQGGNTGEGYIRGVTKKAPAAAAAVAGLGAGRPSGGGERGALAEKIELHFHGKQDPAVVGSIREEVEKLMAQAAGEAAPA